MLRNKLVRSDGSIIDSSVIISCEFTEEVNSNTNLSVGDVTASELTVEIRSTDPVQQDEVLTYYMIEDGVETQIGVFKAEKPTVATRTTMRFSAYDNIIKTETPFSDWLRTNQELFPMPLMTLVEYACSYCGVALATTYFPNADLSVNAFYADGITCRQILAWAGAIAGRFVRANAAGAVEFAWYAAVSSNNVAPTKSEGGASLTLSDDGAGNISIASDNLKLVDDGNGNVTITSSALQVADDGAGNLLLAAAVESSIPFLQGSLSHESYTTDLIMRVQIKHSEDDVGVIYPADATGNCFTISENMILGVASRDDMTLVAESLYTQLKDITYVPFRVTVPRTIRVRAGDRIRVSDAHGNSFESYVMKVAVTPSGTTLSATGDKEYGSNVAVSSEKYNNLTGKVLEISKSVDGLKVKAEDLTGKVSGLELSTESFKTYVEDTFVSGESFEKYKTESEQTAQDFTQRFESLDQYRNETSAHIKSGLLYYNEDGTPVYGVEIGQRTELDGEETFDQYARFTSGKLAFYDQNGNEVSYISDLKQHITHLEVAGSLRKGGFVDTILDDGSVVTKWVGGGS